MGQNNVSPFLQRIVVMMQNDDVIVDHQLIKDSSHELAPLSLLLSAAKYHLPRSTPTDMCKFTPLEVLESTVDGLR